MGFLLCALCAFTQEGFNMALLSPAMQSKSTARGKVIDQFVTWDATDTDGIVFDFTAQGNAMLLREPVCVFVDNTRATGQLTITVEGYAYQLVVQPGMIASLPFMSVALPRVTVKSSEGTSGVTSFIFCDFMLPNFAYEATGISQKTTDTILEEVVSGGIGSESLRVTDAEAIALLTTINSALSDSGSTGNSSNATLKAILAQLKETLSVSDADVLAQLKTTLAVNDGDAIAELNVIEATLENSDFTKSVNVTGRIQSSWIKNVFNGSCLIDKLTVFPTDPGSSVYLAIFNETVPNSGQEDVTLKVVGIYPISKGDILTLDFSAPVFASTSFTIGFFASYPIPGTGIAGSNSEVYDVSYIAQYRPVGN
ncbi:hypothetical protein GC1_00004 [Gluconobacter phage GC1]|uniref:Uncharacterized protein n=1 Tax=Gluconobacter phage GC1 TaxID=2047788 RepID=A0A2I5AR66_9VIRU|nr:hypothetical protein FDJ08_gp04 [Gluconobacter phage GC1]ATS92572.1 hypothetical protein GC1_00004 [Gluconobacter phage GC1]